MWHSHKARADLRIQREYDPAPRRVCQRLTKERANEVSSHVVRHRIIRFPTARTRNNLQRTKSSGTPSGVPALFVSLTGGRLVSSLRANGSRHSGYPLPSLRDACGGQLQSIPSKPKHSETEHSETETPIVQLKGCIHPGGMRDGSRSVVPDVAFQQSSYFNSAGNPCCLKASYKTRATQLERFNERTSRWNIGMRSHWSRFSSSNTAGNPAVSRPKTR